MASATSRRIKTGAIALGVIVAACSDGTTTPQIATLSISIQTSGGDVDLDGYELVVDSVGQRLSDNTTDILRRVSTGAHTLLLTDVAENCTVTSGGPRLINVKAGEVVNVEFAVTCVATGLEIRTHTTGLDVPSSFDLLVNDKPSAGVVANGMLTVTRLEAGTDVVSLGIRAQNCSLVGGPQTVTVTSHTITPVQLEVFCAAATRLERIAFAIAFGRGSKSIALVKPDGSDTLTLALGDFPAWSPDGKSLVFSTTVCDSYDQFYGSDCTGNLVVMDPETWSTFVAGDGSGGLNPAWSPTGDAIAFTRCCAYADRARIYVARVDGSSTVPLTIVGVANVNEPAWSPDGKRIAFTCSNDKSSDLCVINRDGSGFVRLTSDSSSSSSGPAWSPDGTTIAFTSAVPQKPQQVAALPAGGGPVTRLTNGFDPAWSRDGAKIVFAGEDGLFTINRDGSRLTRLTKGAHSAPAWRP
jgi:hypothetical protein